MRRYSIEPRTKNMLKDMYFYHLKENRYRTIYSNNCFRKINP